MKGATCQCTHARRTHRCVSCGCENYQGKPTESTDAPILCTCGHYTDQHSCRFCGCREYWTAAMNAFVAYARPVGRIHRGTGRLLTRRTPYAGSSL